jgi:hypothetical protein
MKNTIYTNLIRAQINIDLRQLDFCSITYLKQIRLHKALFSKPSMTSQKVINFKI